ncbi:MAG: histidine kinase [Bacteroidota bacterium]
MQTIQKALFFGWFVCICILGGWSQVPFQNPKILNSFTGLPSDMVTAVSVDEQGISWIGTNKGLVRFDGTTSESFQHQDKDSSSIVSNYIHDIHPDLSNDKIWIATSQGLSVFELDSRTFHNYYHDPENEHSPLDHQAQDLYMDREGTLWIGFRHLGFVRYRPETDDFQRYCLADPHEPEQMNCGFTARQIQDDWENDSIMWITTTHGLARFNKISGESEVFYNHREDPTEETFAQRTICMLVHPAGKIFIGTWYYGIYVFDIATKTYSDFDPCYQSGAGPFTEDREVIVNMYMTEDQQIWISSWQGVQLYDVASNCVAFSLPNQRYQKIWHSVDHIDSAGRIWSKTTMDGLRIYNPLMQQFKIQTFEDAENPYFSIVRKICEDSQSNHLYIAPQTSKGLFVLDLQTYDWRKVLPPTDNSVLNDKTTFVAWDMLQLDNGNYLVMEENQLLLYTPGAKQLRPYPIQPVAETPRFRGLLKDHLGDIWISGYRAGIWRLNVSEQRLISYQHAIDSLAPQPVGGDYMTEDIRGNIWIREHNGLLVYQRSKDQFVYIGYDPADRKTFRGMGPMDGDEEGGVWIATNRQYLGYAHADSIERGVIRLYGKEEGLIGTGVGLVKMYNKKLLVFTEQGIQVFDPQTRTFEDQFDLGYGLKEFAGNATLLKDGRVAVGGRRFIALFHPDSLRTNLELPKPYVSRFKVFDDPWLLDNDPDAIDSVFLSYRQNFFSFEFSSVGYNLPDEISYRYQLEGFDQGWQDGTKRRFASYTNVPGGEYRFKVEAINNEGLKSASPSITYLHISTVWYQTLWFWLLSILTIAGIVYAIYRWRVGQVRQHERMRTEYERKLADVEMSALRAQMNPHFIFNSLNSIEYYIISNEPENASDYLNRFSRLIRLILQNSKSTLVPLKDELEALKLYIEMESLRFDNLFEYEVRMEKSIDMERVAIPPMLLQPYVENAIWHGLMQKKEGEGKLKLDIRRQDGHLICSIEDNGIGRDAARQLKSKSATSRKSFGMKITSDRLAMLNRLAGAKASVQVFDLQGEDGEGIGTRVELVIPI